MIGQTISHYKILEKLGEGGMGIVYKAEDIKLKRIVALKFLPQHLTRTADEQARFEQEAQSAATLNHPNICTIHAIGEFDGPQGIRQQFIDMEFVDGVTLRKKLPVEKVSDAIAYAIQIGEALHEAHLKGIVHRDIKAENIMVNTKNQIKVMDFGLAKLKGSSKLTRTSSTVGTLAYMAPEQLQGGNIDARSDIFSFGVVVFELLTGRMPFPGEHEAAIMYSIMNGTPEPINKYRKDISPEIERIVHRALEKDPEDRYQHVDDMVSEFRRVQKQSARVSRASLTGMKIPEQSSIETPSVGTTGSITTGRKRNPLFVAGGVSLLVIAAVVIGYLNFFSSHQAIDSLAVLPFANAGADTNTEYLSDGITESLINGLSQLSNLTVMSRSSVFRYKGKDIDPQKVGKDLGVKAILTGSVTQRGDNLLISTELVNVANNSHIWGEQYNEKLSDIISIQEEISKEISDKLRVKLAGDEEKKLEKRSTENTEAYQLYLKGRFYWNKRKADDLYKAIEYFNQAIEKDSNYALAYGGLAATYVLLPEYASVPAKSILPKAEATAKKASELDPYFAEPHAVLGLIKGNYLFDLMGAEEEFKKAIEINPKYPTVYHWFSICLRSQGKYEEGLAEIRRAEELDPLSPVINLNVAEALDLVNRRDEAIDHLKKAIEMEPNYPGAHQGLGLFYEENHQYDDALKEFETARRILGSENPNGLGMYGFVLAEAGKKGEAAKILEQLQTLSKQGSPQALQIAAVYLGLGERNLALDWLDKAYDERDAGVVLLKVYSVWDNLRSEPRFIALLKKIGLEK